MGGQKGQHVQFVDRVPFHLLVCLALSLLRILGHVLPFLVYLVMFKDEELVCLIVFEDKQTVRLVMDKVN